MRTPTPPADAFAWHRAALAGLEPQTDDTPHCGFFKRRLVRGGPFVPARIWLVREIDPDTGELLSDEFLQAECNGAYADPEQLWSWVNGNPIPEFEFNYLMANIAWTLQHAPHEPMANPRQPVDWSKVPTPSFT